VKDTLTKSLSEGERLLQVQGFGDTFGPSARRKRPNLQLTCLDDYVQGADDAVQQYDDTKDVDLHKNDMAEPKDEIRASVFNKGLSKRIWEELYKVIDSSDVLIYVLDARDPDGTRTKSLEDHLKRNCPSKHLIFVLNKCDLVPTSVTQKWVKHLQTFAPTLAF
jgi:nuclear GTP-binding protein